MKEKFYICRHCGNLIGLIHNAGVPMMCCGQKMTELVPGTVDAAQEKHVPVVEQNGSSVLVKVGAVAHPMLPEHFIQWIILETNQGCQVKYLQPGQAPEASLPWLRGRRSWRPMSTATSTASGRPEPFPPHICAPA